MAIPKVRTTFLGDHTPLIVVPSELVVTNHSSFVMITYDLSALLARNEYNIEGVFYEPRLDFQDEVKPQLLLWWGKIRGRPGCLVVGSLGLCLCHCCGGEDLRRPSCGVGRFLMGSLGHEA